ncbi:hypothetical protein E5161_15785 [Cohnella pontilimi]|uniref:Uncharacterized protein n=1 Tax=Cohnella pontilimi TaxID=2564100 RepID=A0A4U0F988_9BACL|nr:hypothetical protein [Cohnella pontilimi]TJY41150.1 hypothetical protein E5161_15785 [Cohnella pontilimi]
METISSNEIARVAEQLERMRKHLLSVYLDVGMEIDETVNKLLRQVNRLNTKIEELDLDLLKYKILSSILDEAGISELLIQMDEWLEENKSKGESKFSKVLSLLDLDNCRDIRQYLSRIDEAVQELKSA